MVTFALWSAEIAIAPFKIAFSSPWHSTRPFLGGAIPGGKWAIVLTCLDENGGSVVVSPERRIGSSALLAAAAAMSGKAAACSGVVSVMAAIEPSGSDAVLLCKLRLILAFLRKSAPSMQEDERLLMTNAGNEKADPSGR